MAEDKTLAEVAESTEAAEKPAKGFVVRGKRQKGDQNLSMAEKAEAVAIWRAGTHTLDQLSKKFGKRPETLSRMFKRMGVAKGEAQEKALREAEARLAEEKAKDAEEAMRRVSQLKERHLAMSQAVAGMAFKDVNDQRKLGKPMGDLAKSMVAYKMAMEVLAMSRKEGYAILQVEYLDEKSKENPDDLPELTVRELTHNDIESLRHANEMGDEDLGETDLDEELDDLDGSGDMVAYEDD